MQEILVPIAGMMIPVIIVPTVLGLKHARFLREMEHLERMKALEMGRNLAEDESWTPASLAMMIGVGVPMGSLLIAYLAGQSSVVIAQPISIAAGMIGLAGVVGGTILAARQLATRKSSAIDGQKPEYDPDAYDVVGRRG